MAFITGRDSSAANAGDSSPCSCTTESGTRLATPLMYAFD
jgi:hypothetical protein